MTKNLPKPVAAAVAIAINGAAAVMMIEPREIAPSPTNPRKTFPEATLLELGESMAHDGQVQAILVRPITVDAVTKFNKEHPDASDEDRIALRYEIVSGERRWRAAGLKGLKLRAEVRELTDLQVVRIQIIENLHREEVHPLEEAEGYEYLLRQSGENITVDQIADEVGKSRSYVHKRLKLAALCNAAREKFLAGDFDASSALLIARIPTPELQLRAIAEIDDLGDDDHDPSYREIRSFLASRFHLNLATAPFDTVLQDLVPGCGSCASCPKRTGNQSALFEDVEDADTCTDPDCFDAKRKAQVARVIVQARKEGLDVVEGKEAQAIRPHYWRPVEGHHALSAVAYEEQDGTKVTYEELLAKGGKKAPKPILFIDPHNQDTPPQRMVSDRAVESLLKKFAPATTQTPANSEPVFDPIAEAQRRAQAIEHELTLICKRELLSKASEPRTAADLLMLLFAIINEDLTYGLLEELGIPEPDDEAARDFDHEGAVIAALREKTGAELAAIAFRMVLGDMEIWASVPGRVLQLAAESHGIDLDALRAEAEQAADREDDESDNDD